MRDTMGPRNENKPWTVEDDADLLKGAELGYSMDRIAEFLRRTPDEVGARLATLQNNVELFPRDVAAS